MREFRSVERRRSAVAPLLFLLLATLLSSCAHMGLSEPAEYRRPDRTQILQDAARVLTMIDEGRQRDATAAIERLQRRLPGFAAESIVIDLLRERLAERSDEPKVDEPKRTRESDAPLIIGVSIPDRDRRAEQMAGPPTPEPDETDDETLTDRDANEPGRESIPGGPVKPNGTESISDHDLAVAETLWQRGRQALARQNRDTAERLFRDAHRIDPQHASIARDLAKVLTERGLELYVEGDVKTAIQVWREALRATPDDSEIAQYLERAEQVPDGD